MNYIEKMLPSLYIHHYSKMKHTPGQHMKIFAKVSSIFFLISLLAVTTVHCQPVNDETCHSFFLVYCTSCHNTQRICKSLETQNEEEWRKMMHTMAKYGNLDKNDEEHALACMRFMKPGSKIVCK